MIGLSTQQMIAIVHANGKRVPLLGMRNTKTGELRPPTEAEVAKLKAQWERFGDPKAKVEETETP